MTDDDGGEILMGRWDCRSGDARGQRGDAYQCSSCAAPRPEDVEFYLPEDAELVTDEAGIAAAEAGPDWQCAFCQSWMPATDASCLNCQAPLADSLRRQRTGDYDEGPVTRGEFGVAAQSGTQHFVAPPQSQKTPRTGSMKPVLIAAGLLATLLAMFTATAGVYGIKQARQRQAYQEKMSHHRQLVDVARAEVAVAMQAYDAAVKRMRDASQAATQAEQNVERAVRQAAAQAASLQQLQNATPVHVASHIWTVNLQIEQCNAKDGEGWTRPNDAFGVRTEQRVHHHEKVLDRVDTLFRTETYRAQDGFNTETYTQRVQSGTRRVQNGVKVENLGNGRFRRTPKYRTEPVYRNVTKTRQKPRMVTKTRQVPYQKQVYRDEPVKKPWYKYQTKVWTSVPRLSRSGAGLDVLDPEGTPPKDPGSELGARRVRSRSVSYRLQIRKDDDESPLPEIVLPLDRWQAIADGDSLLLANSQLLTEVGREARIESVKAELAATDGKLIPLRAEVPLLQAKISPLKKQLPALQSKLETARAALATAERELAALRPEMTVRDYRTRLRRSTAHGVCLLRELPIDWAAAA